MKSRRVFVVRSRSMLEASGGELLIPFLFMLYFVGDMTAFSLSL